MSTCIYVSHPNFQKELISELSQYRHDLVVRGQLIFTEFINEEKHVAGTACFAQDIWHDVQFEKITSISEAVKFLKSKHKYWFGYPLNNIRRTKLIEAQLLNPFPKKIDFSPNKQFPKTGVFALLDANTLLYSLDRSTNIPFYLLPFNEDKINPPNRAYLKLWEALTLIDHYPKPEETVIDLGASPGGWTYVLATLGSKVLAVDKAPLAANLAKFSNIKFLKQSAFSLDPKDFPQVDWLFSDIACYPERLYDLITNWIELGQVKNFVCTIKLQGKTDFALIRKFQAIVGTKIIHLFQNKHELTFILSTEAHN